MDGMSMRGGGGGAQQQQQAESSTPLIPTQSWYPPSVLGPSTSGSFVSSSSGLSTRNPLSRTAAASSSESRSPRYTPSSASASQPVQSSPSISSNALPILKDQTPEELRSLLMDKDMYNSFLHSLDQVRQLDQLRDELKKGNIDLARHNLGKEAEIAELRNQCMIIRNTQLAAARERFEEVEKREKEINGRFSPMSVLDRLQAAATEADEECERIHQQILRGEIDIADFISKYRKQRILYHKRILTRNAAMASLTTPG